MNPEVLLGPLVGSCSSGAIPTTALVSKMSDCKQFFNKEMIATMAEEGLERMKRKKRQEKEERKHNGKVVDKTADIEATPHTNVSQRIGNKRPSRSPPGSSLEDNTLQPTPLTQSFLESIKSEPSFSNPIWASDELERLLAEEAFCDPAAYPGVALVPAVNQPTQLPNLSSWPTDGQSSSHPSADHRTKYVLPKELRRSVWSTATPDRAVWCPPAPASNSSSTVSVIVGGKRRLVGGPISQCPFKTFMEDSGNYRLKNW